MKKKALIVVNLAGFLHFLWNDIATLQEMGYEVSVAMNENSAAGPNLIEIPKLEEMGIAHYQVEFDTKSPVSTQNIQAYKQLKLILKTNKYDLIHCHTPIVGILTRMAARKYRKAGTTVIYTTHGFTFTDKSSKKSWIVYFTAEKLMSRFCDAIITINHEDYGNAKKMHCPKVYVIPSVGLDNHRFANLRINRDEYRASFGVNSKDHMVLAVGELSSRKNQKIIIEALGTLDRKEQYIFVICGTAVVNSTIEEELKETASRLGVRIFLAGHRLDIPEMSSQRIASHLNELGVLPPNEYKRANGFNYTCGFQAGLNQKWTVVSVNRILKNESYTGTLIQGKRRKINYKVKKSHDVGSENWIRVEDAHDAIISKGEFQQVQQLLELDTRTAPSQTTVYPLSGFLRCADCGQNMIRRTVTKNGKKYQYYHCSTYKNGGGCTPHMINSEKLTESVLAAIRHQVTLLVEAEKVLSNAELASGEQIGIKILDSQITALEAELERYSNLKIRLYQDLCDDVVSREEYGEMNTRFAQKIKEAQDKIQEIREKKQEALKHDTLLPTWLEEFKQYEHIKTLERRVVVELIDHIDVHSKTEIEIHFCFEDELHSITEKFMEYQAHHGNEVAEE